MRKSELHPGAPSKSASPGFCMINTKFPGLATARGPILFGLTQSHPGSGDFFLQCSQKCINMKDIDMEYSCLPNKRPGLNKRPGGKFPEIQ